ncbi:hypothetical protein [Mucilaginibacter sp. 3215]|uniref:hypothetical protein n=1 Tax=Mucilaginibacter sp. 3215 TaxID=3373912 RepID=UPI003D208185
MMRRLLAVMVVSIAGYSNLYAQQNDFPLNGDIRINAAKPGNHGAGFSAIWMPNLGALMPENSPDYASIMLTSNVVRNSTTNVWGFADAAMPAWKLQMGHGVNVDNFTIVRSAPLTYAEQVFFKIDKIGNIGIGTANPLNKLDVNGTLHAKQVKIDLVGWSDYVFEKNYQLPALSLVKTYIQENKHLPGVPSEAEMIKTGLDVSEANKLLLRKMEEMTLYMIEAKEEITTLKKEVKRLKSKLNK